MRTILILGGGTAGTIMANRLDRALNSNEWQITVVDRENEHYYQPGFLFIPFGIYNPEDVVKQKKDFFPEGVNFLQKSVERILPSDNSVICSDGTRLEYEYLIVATGTRIAPDETEGLLGPLWKRQIFDFYTFEGAVALAQFFRHFTQGSIVLNITEMPIKCPVAPLEFLFLADEYFSKKGVRDKVSLTFATPLSGAFTRPKAAASLGKLLEKKNISIVPDFNIARVDNDEQAIYSWDEQRIPFDALITIPTNRGDKVIADSGFGDELDFVETDKHTLRSKKHPNIFCLGDATNLPSSKAGSVAHFEAGILERNILDVIGGREPSASFDGHANCFIETGYDKGVLIDFNYEVEPLPGKFPLPIVGPFDLLEESHINHTGKVMFRWIYWHMLLTGRDIPFISDHMSMAGKEMVTA